MSAMGSDYVRAWLDLAEERGSNNDMLVPTAIAAGRLKAGEECLRHDVLFDLQRQGETLKGRCCSARGDIYPVRAVPSGAGLTESRCTCRSEQPCEHAAALLLLWRRAPGRFVEIDDIETALRRTPGEAQIAMLKELIRRQPEIEAVVEARLGIEPKQPLPVEPERFRKQVAALFASVDEPDGGIHRLIEGLDAIRRLGDEYRERGHLLNAVAVAEAIAREVSRRYAEFYDEESELSEIADRSVRCLGACLDAASGADREKILRALFDLLQFDLAAGTLDLGRTIGPLLVNRTRAEEKRLVARWITEVMERSPPSRRFYPCLAALLIDLAGDTLAYPVLLELCQATGRTADLVMRLLRLGLLEDAARAVRSSGDDDFLALVDLLVGAGHDEVAESLVVERARATGSFDMLRWLKDFDVARGRTAAALDRARELLLARPSVERYHEVAGLGRALGQWGELRGEILDALERRNEVSALAQIYLAEGDIDRAIKAAERVVTSVWGTGGVVLEVAFAAEASRPDAALDLFRRHVEHLIDEKKRASYRRAAEFLLRMRDIHEKKGDLASWARLVRDLRSAHQTRHALIQEMNAHGL